ncbi:MAG: phenylalanine--tRNA ligase subunit alpha, partial [Thermoproteota archaeon]|nr:phenylalanine--tRNA ligase subunit alpha [Thermoproteota archaeon]
MYQNDNVSINSLVTNTGLSIDQIRRGVEWLKFKNLISIKQISKQNIVVTPQGLEASKNGLPERRLVNSLRKGKANIAEVIAAGDIKKEEINAAIAGARRNHWIELVEGNMIPTASADSTSPEERFLKKIIPVMELSKLTEEDRDILDRIKKRPNYIEIKEEKQTQISLTESARKILPSLNQQEYERILT